DALACGLDVLKAFARHVLTSNSVDAGYSRGLVHGPSRIGDRQCRQRGAKRCRRFRGSCKRRHVAFHTGQPNISAELFDLLAGQWIGENRVYAILGVGLDPIAGRVVSDGEGADIAIVQVGEARVEVSRVVGSAVVALLEAAAESELQPGLETERD